MKTLFKKLSKEHQEIILDYDDLTIKDITLKELNKFNFVFEMSILVAFNLEIMLKLKNHDYVTISLLFQDESN